MRNILISVFMLLSFAANTQVNGNKKIITRTFEIEAFDEVYIGFPANYEIDYNMEPSLEITMDENLFPYFEKDVKGGKLTFDQIKWIEPSLDAKIKVGGKGFVKLTQSGYSDTKIININAEKLSITAEEGDIRLSGKVKELTITVNTGEVDASGLDAEKGVLTFNSRGRIVANVSGEVKITNKEKGRLVLNGEGEKKIIDSSIRFMEFVIRNNSANRHHFVVEGPKADGSSFSYGFALMPFQKRDKNWTNGTKVYKVNNLGLKTLVKTIQLSDEGKVVDIFEKE